MCLGAGWKRYRLVLSKPGALTGLESFFLFSPFVQGVLKCLGLLGG